MKITDLIKTMGYNQILVDKLYADPLEKTSIVIALKCGKRVDINTVGDKVYDKPMMVQPGDIFIVLNTHVEKFNQSIGVEFSDVGTSITILKNEESILMIPDQKRMIKILFNKLKENNSSIDMLKDKIKLYKLRSLYKSLSKDKND